MSTAAMTAERPKGGRIFPARPRETPKGNQWRPADDNYRPRRDGEYGACGLFRSDLKTAGIDRRELHEPTKTSLAVRFHDLRASGITWRAARGDDARSLRQECGHEDQATNDLYLRTLRGLYGTNLFPELPLRLLGEQAAALAAMSKSIGSGNGSRNQSTPRKKRNMVGAEGFEDTDTAGIRRIGDEPMPLGHARVDASARELVGVRPTEMQTARTVEEALAHALSLAAQAQQWAIVAQLGRELEARRLAGSNVSILDAARRR